MAHADEWFHEQLLRLRPPSVRVKVTAAAPGVRGRDRVLGSTALVALVALLVMEALRGPMVAERPFGLPAPGAVFGASSVPSVNGRGPAAPVEDRNKIVLSGIGSRR